MAEPIWELKYKGEPVSITLDDLTRHRMREIGGALGEEYRVPQEFMASLFRGDLDAIAGALWVHGQVSGKPVGDMNTLDFSPSDFTAADEPKRAPKGRKPTTATPDETISPETPKS
jgi:hypothetical protein